MTYILKYFGLVLLLIFIDVPYTWSHPPKTSNQIVAYVGNNIISFYDVYQRVSEVAHNLHQTPNNILDDKQIMFSIIESMIEEELLRQNAMKSMGFAPGELHKTATSIIERHHLMKPNLIQEELEKAVELEVIKGKILEESVPSMRKNTIEEEAIKIEERNKSMLLGGNYKILLFSTPKHMPFNLQDALSDKKLSELPSFLAARGLECENTGTIPAKSLNPSLLMGIYNNKKPRGFLQFETDTQTNFVCYERTAVDNSISLDESLVAESLKKYTMQKAFRTYIENLKRKNYIVINLDNI